MRSPESVDVVVYGATGLVGKQVCAELEAAGVAFAIAGRDRARLDALAAELPAATTRVATIVQLAGAVDGARVIVNCAGPAREVGEPILVGALTAGAHYVDLGGDQGFVQRAYERHESMARRAGLVAICGAALDCAIGDWAAAWAAGHVCGVARDDGDALREAPAARLADDRPLDDVAVSYVFDDLVLSPAGQRGVFSRLHDRGLAWRRDRWEPTGTGSERRRINAGHEMGGERDVVSFPASDVITIPRHLNASSVQTFASTTRHKVATTALRLLARAMPLVPRRATELLVPYVAHDEDYARTHFAIVAQARRGFAAAQVIVRGRDQYRTTAIIAAWCARQLVTRTTGPVGMRAPSELFRPEPALREIAVAANLVVEPSFG